MHMQIIKHIPNTITSMNLISGTLGVIFTLHGRIDIAFPLMLAAAGFDFCDGFAARLLKAYSEIGKELDSLADMVSFGVLPAIMLYKTMTVCGTWDVICYVPLVLAAFSALRLAKFNIDERQHGSFIGLATPAAAMICGSLAYYVELSPNSWLSSLCGTWYFIPLIAVILSALLVSEIPMFAMKFGKGLEVDNKTKMLRTGFLSGIVCIIVAVFVLGANWSLVVLFMFLYYLLLNLAVYAADFKRK